MGISYIGENCLSYITKTLLKNDKTINDKLVNDIKSLEAKKITLQECKEEITKAQLEPTGIDTTTLTYKSEFENALLEGVLRVNLTFERGTVAGTGATYDSTKDYRSISCRYEKDTDLIIDIPSEIKVDAWRYNSLSEDALQVETITESGTYKARGGFYYYFVLKTIESGGTVTEELMRNTFISNYPELDYKEKIRAVDAKVEEIRVKIKVNYATQYTSNEDSVINSVFRVLNPNTIVFGLITDNHCGIPYWDNLYNHGKVLNSLCERVGADFAINLGDVFVEVDDHGENLKRMKTYWNNSSMSYIPNMYVKGNHECFVTGDGSVALEDWQLIGQTNRSNKYIQKSNNSLIYYFDIRGCRFIVLDSSSNTNDGFSDEHESFLQNAFSTIGDKKAVVFTHIPLDAKQMLQATPVNANKLRAILSANKDKVIAVMHGHTHWDHVTELDGIKYISTCCAMCGKLSDSEIAKYTGSGTPAVYDRSYNTYSEYCMDIVVVDTNSKFIRTFRFGAGKNRVIDCN